MKHLSRSLLLALLISSTAFAGSWKTQNGTSSRFDLTLGGGYSQLGYQINQSVLPATMEARSMGSWNAKAHLGYKFFFTNWMGISAGVNFQRYGGGIALNGQATYNDVADTDGEQYNHTLSLHQWQQHDQIYMVEIPLSLCFAIPVRNALDVTLELGGQYGLPVLKNYKGLGETSHTGYYPQWHLTLTDQPDHGFYTESNFTPTGDIPTKNAWSLFGKLGIAVPLTDHTQLLAQVYGHYCLTTPFAITATQTFGFRNDREGMRDAHYFMNDYASLHTTNITKPNPKPLSVGLEIGVRFVIPHKSTHCICRLYDNGPIR